MRQAEDYIDTIEKAKDIIFCLKYSKAYERVTALLELRPDIKSLPHRVMADLLGLQRETVSRILNIEGIHKRR